MRIKLEFILAAALVVMLAVQRADAAGDWSWYQARHVWAGSHDCGLTENNGAKAVSLDSVYDGDGVNRSAGVAVQDVTDDGNMNVVFFEQGENGTWNPREDPVKPRDGDVGGNGAFAYAAHGVADDNADTVVCIWYDSGNHSIEFASTSYDLRHSAPWQTDHVFCYDLKNGDIAVDAWKLNEGESMVYVAFVAGPLSFLQPGVYVVRSTDGGTTWAAPVIVKESNVAANVSVAAERVYEDRVCVAFQEHYDDEDEDTVRFYFSTDFGVTWELTHQWADATEPCISTVRNDYQVAAVWIRASTGDIYCAWNTRHGRQEYWYPDNDVGALCECFHNRPADGFSYSHPSVGVIQESKQAQHEDERNVLFAVQVHSEHSGLEGEFVASSNLVFDMDGTVTNWSQHEHWRKTSLDDGSANPSIAAYSFARPVEDDSRAICVWARLKPESYGARDVMAGFAEYVRTPAAALPIAQTDGPARRLRLAAEGSLAYCSREGANIHAGPATTDGLLLPILAGGGELSSIAVDGDSKIWTAYTLDNSVLCDVAWGDTCVTVFTGDSTVIPGQPSIALYPTELVSGGWAANIVFPVFDTVNGESRILYAKINGENLVLDTIHEAQALSDSCPCVNVAGETVYVTMQSDGQVVSRVLGYGVDDWDAPGSWSAPDTVAELGLQAMSAVDGDYLHLVWREVITMSAEEVIRTATRYVGSDTTLDHSWQAGPDASQTDGCMKACPVYAGEGVIAWQEKPCLAVPWRIRASVFGDTVTLVATDTGSYHPHAVAVKSAVSPSVDQIAVNLLWTEGVVFEVDSGVYDTGATRFEVCKINHSNAQGGSTYPSNGSKLVRKPDSDSLFSAYKDAAGFVMYAWSADGSAWSREPLFGDSSLGGGGTATGAPDPALAFDSTGRLWVVLPIAAMPDSGDSTHKVIGSYRTDDTWATPRLLYEVRCDSGWVGSPSLAGASDDEVPCAYAAFTKSSMAGGADLVVVKFDCDSLVTSSATPSEAWPDMPCIAAAPTEGGDYVHLSWIGGGVARYTMTTDPVPADSWSPSPLSWEDPVALSSSTVYSWGAVVGASQSKVVVTWTDPGDWSQGLMPNIFGRSRSTDSTYDNWEDIVDLSQSPYMLSENSYISMVADSVVVAWDEVVTGDWSDFDVFASVNFGDPFVLVNTEGQAVSPHVVLQNKVSGESTLAYVHTIWGQYSPTWEYEVGYERCLLNPSGEGQQSGGGPVIQPLLYACRPNPFSRRTQISYQFPKTGKVVLRVYDASGRVVKTLQNGMQERGSYTVSWDGRDDRGRTVANGVYFYRVDAPGLRDTKKAVVTK